MRSLILLASLFFFTTPSLAYFSLMDTGQVKKEGEYRVLGEGQVLFDAPEGFNLNARFATGIDDESEIQFEGGLGSVDYYIAAFWKWMPFPDTTDQPAIGLRAGITFADVNDVSRYGFNVTPMISKLFDTDLGDISPYGGVEMGLQNDVNETDFTMQAVLGVQWSPNEWDFPGIKDFNFLVEYGLEVDDAFNYLSFGASYDF